MFAFVPVLNLGQATHDTNQDVVLDISVLADIFAANITNWRDSRIIESLENAGSGEIANLMPDANITVRNRFGWLLLLDRTRFEMCERPFLTLVC